MATSDDNLEFYAKFVTPYYGDCMNHSVLRQSIDEQARFVSRFRAVMPQYTSEMLAAMLRDSNWRPGKVAAWVIAAHRDASFVPLIRETMLARPSHVEHLCAALAVLGTDDACEALEAYLDKVLANREPLNELLDPDPAIAAIEVIDREQNTRRVDRFVSAGGQWDAFVRARPEFLANHWKKRLTGSRECLPQAVEFIRYRLS